MQLFFQTSASLIFLLFLASCGSITAQFKQASEANENQPKSQLRIIANSFVKAVPDKNCIDWGSPGAGTVFGGMVGSDGYKGRSLNMPFPPASVKSSNMAEMFIAANKPITLVFQTGAESAYFCSISGSFIPEKEKNYEATLMMDESRGRCFFNLIELGEIRVPIKISAASDCK